MLDLQELSRFGVIMLSKNKMRIFCLIALILGLCAQCGTKSATTINIILNHGTGVDDPFDVANGVNDIVFIVQDLDVTTPKTLVYPTDCSTFTTGCGFSINDNYNLELCFKECGTPDAFIVPEHPARLIFCARNGAGEVLFYGESTQFYNDPSIGTQNVTINVSTETPPFDTSCL